jgi:hypothetical protein
MSERDADPAGDLREPSFGFLAVGEVERRPRRQLIEYRLQFDLLVDPAEFVDAFLQSLGDRQVVRFDDIAAIGLCRRLRAEQQVIDPYRSRNRRSASGPTYRHRDSRPNGRTART